MKFSVPEMSCGHCTAAIEKAVKEADPAAALDFDLSSRNVTIRSSLSADDLGAAISQAGYESEPVAG